MLYNPYKQKDIFVCRHEAHRDFEYRVSAWHVLREKRCYPHGCIDFIWKCKLLSKGGTCHKGYQFVGTNCGQCRHYDEEKIQRYPELQVSEERYQMFLRDCTLFDEWLEDHVGRQLEAGGRITDIRPNLIRRVDGRRSVLTQRGFLIRLSPAYIARDGFDDALYLRISNAQQKRHRLAVYDSIECHGWIRFHRGRIVIEDTRRFFVDERGGGEPATWDRALLDRINAVTLEGQPGRCMQCERGVLVDVEDGSQRRRSPRREMLCLEGIGRPRECPYEIMQAMHDGRRPDSVPAPSDSVQK